MPEVTTAFIASVLGSWAGVQRYLGAAGDSGAKLLLLSKVTLGLPIVPLVWVGMSMQMICK